MLTSRTPVGSGTLYPSLPARLRADIRAYFDAAPAAPRGATGLLVPHGPFVAAGPVLGAAVASVALPPTCVILGANHGLRARAPHDGSLLAASAYRTPLGDVPPDESLAAALAAAAGGLLAEDPVAHEEESAIEVVLPFLQVRRPDVRIVPILLGWHDWERAATLARALHETLAGRDDVLVIAVSDMSHGETESVAADRAALALDRVVSTDPEGLLRVTAAHDVAMCGRIPVACVLQVARLAGRTVGEVVGYSHSGVPTGERTEVTGYAAALIGLA